ncbi:collagenase [Undibacterium sp. TS12]|uniref:collagenase n=1 Tax=Undibacterium sp. TS12 TaxID=2908202 RepID=UPI001F4C76A9|nr:collagenase [Undibacterium sp. TS12]MCH8617975.1 collagenase [Undibacterium sp. TS12]
MRLTIRGAVVAASALYLVGCASNPPSVQTEQDKKIQQVLSHVHQCSNSLSLRSQALSHEQENQTCQMLGVLEKKFHDMFATGGKPVKDDFNTSLRANIYQSKEDFEKYAGQHFDMPTNNGGMYLEGLPDRPGNQAEFVANQRKDGSIHNLGHEYIHYLDGRFNLYGDFCANLQDSHSPPENCARPAPLTPYLVWWTEGIAEYVAKGTDNPAAIKAAAEKSFALSQLFDTGYESNNGVTRIYSWGYLAVRFMMEKHRPEVERMLVLTRSGDYPRYQSLVRSWGTSMDQEFAQWLEGLVKPA